MTLQTTGFKQSGHQLPLHDHPSAIEGFHTCTATPLFLAENLGLGARRDTAVADSCFGELGTPPGTGDALAGEVASGKRAAWGLWAGTEHRDQACLLAGVLALTARGGSACFGAGTELTLVDDRWGGPAFASGGWKVNKDAFS